MTYYVYAVKHGNGYRYIVTAVNPHKKQSYYSCVGTFKKEIECGMESDGQHCWTYRASKEGHGGCETWPQPTCFAFLMPDWMAQENIVQRQVK